MEKLEVFGGHKLKGEVKISGSKNSSLPILAATLLSNKKVILKNIPNVDDISTMISLLASFGSKIKEDKKNNSVEINNNKINKMLAAYSLVKTMRAGILVLGPLLARYRKATVSLPGGCNIGARPIDLHLKALTQLGMSYKIINGYVYAKAPNGLIGNSIVFKKISVGATQNLIIAASMAKGVSNISNCSIEPEVKDLVNFLNKIGCKIKWVGKRKVKIIGVKKFNELSYSVMFDRIEAGTFAIAAACSESNLRITNINPKIIKYEIGILKKIGAKINLKKNEIIVKGSKKIKSINLTTAPYPNGLPTDLQAQMMVLLCRADKRSTLCEKIFENRFLHVAELNRMNAKIKIKNNRAIIEPRIQFQSTEVMATDLRASVSLILAALIAKGKTTIQRVYHLRRGYENLEQKLKRVGAKIKRVA